MMKLKFLPVAAFGLVTMLTTPSHAIFGFLADAFNSGCEWNAKRGPAGGGYWRGTSQSTTDARPRRL